MQSVVHDRRLRATTDAFVEQQTEPPSDCPPRSRSAAVKGFSTKDSHRGTGNEPPAYLSGNSVRQREIVRLRRNSNFYFASEESHVGA